MFDELYDRAKYLSIQKSNQRRVKMYFDSNDEFVLEEELNEFYDSMETSSKIDGEE